MDFLGVELFQTGTWKDSKGRANKWTTKDLDDIVANFKDAGSKLNVPLKLGHDEKQKLLDGEPAIGWIDNLQRKGNKLVGDFKKVPDKLGKLIEQGSYRTRSVEIWPDFELEGKEYNWMLTGVALLGSQLPAISGLSDIVALYDKKGIEHDEQTELVVFSGSEGIDEEEDLEEELKAFVERLNSKYKGKHGAPHMRALQTALANSIRSMKGRIDNEMDKAKLIKLLNLKEDASEEEIEAAITKSQKEPDSKKEHSKEEEPNQEVTELQGRIIELEKAQAVGEASRVVDAAIEAGKLLPKQREFAMTMATRNKAEFEKFVEAQPNLVELGEKGKAPNETINFSKFEPSQAEIDVAKSMNLYSPEWRKNIMNFKAAEAGTEIPVTFFGPPTTETKPKEEEEAK